MSLRYSCDPSAARSERDTDKRKSESFIARDSPGRRLRQCEQARRAAVRLRAMRKRVRSRTTRMKLSQTRVGQPRRPWRASEWRRRSRLWSSFPRRWTSSSRSRCAEREVAEALARRRRQAVASRNALAPARRSSGAIVGAERDAGMGWWRWDSPTPWPNWQAGRTVTMSAGDMGGAVVRRCVRFDDGVDDVAGQRAAGDHDRRTDRRHLDSAGAAKHLRRALAARVGHPGRCCWNQAASLPRPPTCASGAAGNGRKAAAAARWNSWPRISRRSLR